MRNSILIILLAIFLPDFSTAQETLVREEANDTFLLADLKITGLAVLEGRQWVPFNLAHENLQNLLYWRYFDDFLGKTAYYPTEMLTAPSTLLLDELKPTDTVSLHINLVWTDYDGMEHAIYILASGFTKELISAAPWTCSFDPDPNLPLRFSAVARMKQLNGSVEVYDTVEGELKITRFDPRKSRIAGSFNFIGDCVGIRKYGKFVCDEFKK